MPQIAYESEQYICPLPFYRQLRLFQFQFFPLLQPLVGLKPNDIAQRERRERGKIANPSAEMNQSSVFVSAVGEFFSAVSVSAFCALRNFAVATQTALLIASALSRSYSINRSASSFGMSAP